MSDTRHDDVIRLRRPSVRVWAVSVPIGLATAVALENPGSWRLWLAATGVGLVLMRKVLAAVWIDESGVSVGLGEGRNLDWARVEGARLPESGLLWSTPVLVLIDGSERPMPPLRCRRNGPSRRYADLAIEMINARALLNRGRGL